MTSDMTWFLIDAKEQIQVFTSQRDIDMSLKPQITEDYLHKIDQNKVRPIEVQRDLIPLPWILAIGLVVQQAMAPESFGALTI